jgi:hypothetical protein
VVFEIIKQGGCYEYFFELSYSWLPEHNRGEENRKEIHFDLSLR